MNTLLHDLRYAFRSLRNSPGFTAVVVLTLALGIGANCAIFSVVNGVLLKPLEYRAPDELVAIYSQFPTQGFYNYWVSAPEYRELQEYLRSVPEIGAWAIRSSSLTGTEVPMRVTTALASAELFSVLGVPAQLGRVYTEAEDTQGAPLTVVISHGLWQSAFAGDQGILGRQIEVNEDRATVVGVMPPGFDIGEAGAELWLPLGLPENLTAQEGWWAPGNHQLNLVGRLAPGATSAQAQAEMHGLLARWKELSGSQLAPNETTHPMVVTSLHEEVVGGIRPALLILLGAVGFVLLIACANVANLLLAKGEGRRNEIALRSALGADRARLLRQFLTESLLLAVTGGVLGLLIGYGGLQALLAMSPASIPRAEAIGLDLTVLVFTLAVSVLTGLIFGAAPLLHLSPRRMGTALRDSGQRFTGGAGRKRLRRLLVVSEIALAVVLVIGSGLLLRSFAALQDVDPGFEPEGLITFETFLPGATYPDATDASAVLGRLLERVESLPGVTGAAAMSGLPPVREVWGSDFAFEGRPDTPGGSERNVDYFQVVSGDYLDTMGIPLIAGRAFAEGDGSTSTPVVIINQTLAELIYPEHNAIGRRIRPVWVEEWFTIIGVVGDVKQGGLSEDISTEVYFHAPQMDLVFGVPRGMNIVIRSSRPASALADEIRRVVWSVDSALPIAHVQSMEANLAGSISRSRFLTLLLTVFAGVALALAAVGIYGVLSYSVAERRREIGIRMALGARAKTVMAEVLQDGLVTVLVGLAFGVLGALALTQLISSLLFGVGALDTTTFLLAPFVLALVAIAACLIPARRATRVDPAVTLRAE